MDKHLIKESFEIPLYNGRIIVMFADYEAKVSEHYDDCEDDWIVRYGHCFCVNEMHAGKLTRAYLMAFNVNNEYKAMSHGCIAHEALHATSFILDYAGLKFKSASEEAYAYLISWITDKIYNVIASNEIDIRSNKLQIESSLAEQSKE